MIAEAKDYMFFSPWVIVIPGVALFVLVLGINLLGDGLRDMFGARSRRMSALLEVEQARGRRFGRTALAVRGASLTVERGETHCLVGEFGCGKSVTALADHEPAGPQRAARAPSGSPSRARTCCSLRRRHGAAARQRAWR